MATKAKKIVVKDLPAEMNTKDVVRVLGCTPMAVYNYRMGKCVSKEPLPYYETPQGKVRSLVTFKRTEFVSWAKKNGFKELFN